MEEKGKKDFKNSLTRIEVRVTEGSKIKNSSTYVNLNKCKDEVKKKFGKLL